MKHTSFYALLSVALFCFGSASYGQTANEEMDSLKLESIQERQIILDEYQRDRLVKKWAKKLAKLDDRGLGSVKNKHESELDLQELKAEIIALTKTYNGEVRPILLNNVKLKRRDSGAQLNRTHLSQLTFASKYNHKTKKPISGVFNYEEDVSDSIFSSQMAPAGLLVNNPKLADEQWVKDALKMESETYAFLRIHLAYMDGVKFTAKRTGEKWAVKSDLSVSAGKTIDGTHTWPDHKREKEVRKFVRRIQKLDKNQTFASLKVNVAPIIEAYANKIKPVLVDNVNKGRTDVGARANKGDLIALFYTRSKDRFSGTPISDRVNETRIKDGENFEENNPVIVNLLNMENELKTLLKEHQTYLKNDNQFMY